MNHRRVASTVDNDGKVDNNDSLYDDDGEIRRLLLQSVRRQIGHNDDDDEGVGKEVKTRGRRRRRPTRLPRPRTGARHLQRSSVVKFWLNYCPTVFKNKRLKLIPCQTFSILAFEWGEFSSSCWQDLNLDFWDCAKKLNNRNKFFLSKTYK